MKNLALILVAVFTLASCTKSVEDDESGNKESNSCKSDCKMKEFNSTIKDEMMAEHAGPDFTDGKAFLDKQAYFQAAGKDKDKNVLVAICQIFCLDDDRAGNFLRIENALIEAKAKGAEIATFAETAIYGWINPDAHDKAYHIPGMDSERICNLAKKYGMYICIGLAEKDGDDLYDAVILVNDLGEIILKHRKINTLDELLDPPYTKGTEIKAVDTKFGKISMIICADSFIDEHAEKVAELEADLLIIPYGWANDEQKWPVHGLALVKRVSTTAKIAGCPVVGTDLVGQISKGPWKGKTYGGWSNASDKDGKTLIICADRDKDIRIVEIEPGR